MKTTKRGSLNYPKKSVFLVCFWQILFDLKRTLIGIKSHVSRSTIDNPITGTYQLRQGWGRGKRLFQFCEWFGCFFCPRELTFEQQVCQWTSDQTVVADEFPIVTGKTKEASQFRDRSWRGPVKHRRDFLPIHFHSFIWDDMAKILQLPLTEDTLFVFHRQFVLTQDVKNVSDMWQVFLPWAVVY